MGRVVRPTGFAEADERGLGDPDEHRVADLDLLRELVRDHEGDLRDEELGAFEDMLDAVQRGRRAQLSDAQRAWAERVADRLGASYSPRAAGQTYSSGAVPDGRPVPTPAALRDLPKRPPNVARRLADAEVSSFLEEAENDGVEVEITRGRR